MTGRTQGSAVFLAALLAPAAARAQSDGPDTLAIGTAIGQAILILLGAIAGLSVLAKLSIVFGLVPREPENRFQALVHGTAGIVGRLRPARSLRHQRRASRFTDNERS